MKRKFIVSRPFRSRKIGECSLRTGEGKNARRGKAEADNESLRKGNG